ncbi:MAG TPA: sulfite exporter TauE/SafE family protein [Pantanalinema sp.]
MTILLLAIGFVGAFISGLLGVGGAIVLIPMLLYLPPLLGLGRLGIVEIGGMSIVQVLVASLLGLLSHRRAGHFSRRVALPMGIAMAVASALGAGLSSVFSGEVLRALFALLAGAAALLMVLPAPASADGEELPEGFSPALASAIASLVGLLSGLLGAGGAFMLTPLMRSVLGLPMRLIIGNSLAIVFISALSASATKALTAQIPYQHAALLVAGALAGSPLGARASLRAPVKALRWIMAIVIGSTAVKMTLDLLR